MEKKLCKTCGVVKPLERFSKRSDRKSGYTAKCKECHNKYYKEYWQNTKAYDNHKKRVRILEKGYREQRQEVVYQRLLGGCTDCKATDIRVLEFDHLPEFEKEFSIADTLSLRIYISHQKFIEELEKCEVVCGNCHKIRTFERNPTWKKNYLPPVA